MLTFSSQANKSRESDNPIESQIPCPHLFEESYPLLSLTEMTYMSMLDKP